MKIKNLILIALGFIFLSLGAVGMVFPVLPTTPFVLLSAGCFSAGSKKFLNRLLQNRIFGPYLENYRTGQDISKKRKISALIFLWGGLILSMVIVRTIQIYIILGVVGVAVSIHLLTIKTRQEIVESDDVAETSSKAERQVFID